MDEFQDRFLMDRWADAKARGNAASEMNDSLRYMKAYGEEMAYADAFSVLSNTPAEYKERVERVTQLAAERFEETLRAFRERSAKKKEINDELAAEIQAAMEMPA